METGRPESLLLFSLNPAATKARAAGPGPICKRDWKLVANKHILGRRAILHADRARAYKMKLDKVIHCNVMHNKKRKIVRGKAWFGVEG